MYQQKRVTADINVHDYIFFTNSPLTDKPKFISVSGNLGIGGSSLSVIYYMTLEGAGRPPHYTMENKRKPYVNLPAITKNRCCDLTGQQVRGPALCQASVWLVPEKLSTAQVPGRDSVSLFNLILRLLLFETLFLVVCPQLKFQLAGRKTPVTLK